MNEPLISVIVVSYNHEPFIGQCLEGIFEQEGNFRMELVIGDDLSTDQTGRIIQTYAERADNTRIHINVLPTHSHLGMVQNYKRCFEACTGQYVAVCEGDDYWTDPRKLEKQVEFLQRHPNCSMCFNDLNLLFQDSGELMPAPVQQRLKADTLTAKDLVLENSIWNFSCCMYDARYISQIPQDLYDLFFADWMFNICYAQFGDIGHLKELMSVYRKHGKSAWSSKTPTAADGELYALIDDYNKFLDYKYDAEFSKYQRDIEERGFLDRPSDLVIFDDVFPDPDAPDRSRELMYYLRELPMVTIYSSVDLHQHGPGESPRSMLADFKKKYPQFAPSIKAFHPRPSRRVKAAYCASLPSAYQFAPAVEHLRAPFLFSFAVDGESGPAGFRLDDMLHRVLKSPCFTKVIVRSANDRDLLIRRYRCRPEQIDIATESIPTIDILEQEIANFAGNQAWVDRRIRSLAQRILSLVKDPARLKGAAIYRLKAVVPPKWKHVLKASMRSIRGNAVQRVQPVPGRRSLTLDGVHRLHNTAVILHLFYTDLWNEIATYLQNLDGDFDLYISLPEGKEEFESVIRTSYPDAHIFFLENRGRDAGPFVLFFRAIYPLGYEYVLKIHAKKSSYRAGGDVWRQGLLEGLLGSRQAVQAAMIALSQNAEIGLVCPVGYTLKCALYWGKVEAMTRRLARKIDIRMDDHPDFFFPAGTMFWAKVPALQKFARLPLTLGDFEPEPIHHEGNMPHAIERLIGLTVEDCGYRLSEIDERGNEVPSPGVVRNEFFGV